MLIEHPVAKTADKPVNKFCNSLIPLYNEVDSGNGSPSLVFTQLFVKLCK